LDVNRASFGADSQMNARLRGEDFFNGTEEVNCVV
jgi:hypothetical protein